MGKKTAPGNWKRVEKKTAEPVVLVGFGKYDLVDLMKYKDTDDEEKLVSEPFEKGWPPRYRRASACTQEEIQTFSEFTNFITNVVAQ
jgi:hypothetical protein